MRENGIKIIRTQKYKATTDSNHAFNIAPNVLDQDFFADAPNQKWAGDISYIWTSEGWLYLAVILDLYSRRVIGWAVSNRMKRDLAIRALDMALDHCRSDRVWMAPAWQGRFVGFKRLVGCGHVFGVSLQHGGCAP
jgi:transposase InsO family protein